MYSTLSKDYKYKPCVLSQTFKVQSFNSLAYMFVCSCQVSKILAVLKRCNQELSFLKLWPKPICGVLLSISLWIGFSVCIDHYTHLQLWYVLLGISWADPAGGPTPHWNGSDPPPPPRKKEKINKHDKSPAFYNIINE